MSLVLDCSVIANALLDQPMSHHALDVLNSNESLHAPMLVASELANALWLQVHSGRLSLDEALERLTAVHESGIELVGAAWVCATALPIAAAQNHPFYDCEYIALAAVMDASLVTADRRQLGIARVVLGERAIWLGDI